jgi:polyisoprenyl-teichoic acid--peptidoglycan teichoic acid transferase
VPEDSSPSPPSADPPEQAEPAARTAADEPAAEPAVPPEEAEQPSTDAEAADDQAPAGEAPDPDATNPDAPDPDATNPDEPTADALSADGSGAAGITTTTVVVRPALSATDAVEPQAPGPVDRGRTPLWARALIALGVLLMVGSLTGLVAGKLLLDRYTGSVHQEHLLGGAQATAPASGAGGGEPVPASIDGPLNVLLVGIDERTNAPADGARADSIIILHVPADHESAYLISVPRDSRVHIPAYPKTGYRGGTDKINAAFAYGWLNGGGRQGGFELLALTLKELTGISFNAGAIINFDGFTSVVDALGGVDMCVDEKTTSVHVGWDANGKETPPYDIVPPDYTPRKIYGVRPQVYEVGCQHMAGWEALDYVRQRELLPDGDYGRERHQQQFLKAVAKKLTSIGVLANPLRLDSVLRSAANTLTFDGGGYSVTDWLFNLKAISPGNIVMLKTNGGQFNSEYIGGQAFEILDDTSLQLLQAARDDTVDQFVVQHPDWVAGDTISVPASSSPSPAHS